MKKCAALAGAVLLLLFATGCSNTNEQTDPIEVPSESAPDLVELSVSDLNELLAALDLSEAALTCRGKTDGACDAGGAIRADRYIEKLKNFTWENSSAPEGWDAGESSRYQLTAPGVTLTANQSSQENTRFLHVAADRGEGLFALPYLAGEEDGEAEQESWMIYDIFQQWYYEAYTASLYGGAGTPLTAEELDWFADYTASERICYREARDSEYISSTEISCFFTSYYETAAQLNFEGFMWYFPGDGAAGPVTDAEFEALRHVEVWPFKEVESLDSMPVPIHKYSRGEVDAVLTKYAGITTAELDTSSVPYLAEYDSYYTYTSDFGPGFFRPCYGERSGGTVTLWTAPTGESSASDRLVLQKSGENWQILSHQPAGIS